MTAGALYQIKILNTNSENNFLDYDPQITFFKVVYRKHTRFAIENLQFDPFNRQTLDFDSNVTLKCNAPRLGDLLSQVYFTFDLPNIWSGKYGDTSNGVNIQTLKATISGSEVSLLTPKFFFGNSSNFISGSNGNIEIFNTGTTTLSGSQVTIETPKFFMGGTQQFLSGSGGNLEISSSGFHLTPQGDVSASNILLGDKGLGDFLEFNSGVLTVQGEVFAKSINTPATAAVPSASITSDGFAKFVSASVGGWTVNESQIRGGNLILGKEGFIRSTDYISDQSGFIITAQENGYAEFENIKVRGTLATTTFEKESVNAIGGQLFVANSTAITGSGGVAAEVTATSMSVVNATGFTAGEVLLIKKVDN